MRTSRSASTSTAGASARTRVHPTPPSRSDSPVKDIGKLSSQGDSTETAAASPNRNLRSGSRTTDIAAAVVLGAPGNLSGMIEPQPFEISDVNTFISDPRGMKFVVPVPKIADRAIAMQSAWTPSLYFEACTYFYTPNPAFPMSMAPLWLDLDRKKKIETWTAKFIDLKKEQYADGLGGLLDDNEMTGDRIYMQLLRPINFIEHFPDAVERILEMRKTCLMSLSAKDRKYLQDTYGFVAEDIPKNGDEDFFSVNAFRAYDKPGGKDSNLSLNFTFVTAFGSNCRCFCISQFRRGCQVR